MWKEVCEKSLNMFVCFIIFFHKDDLSYIRKNRMALIQHLTCVLPILDSLLTAKVINEQEHDVIKQKTQTSSQAKELINTVIVKGKFAATIFRNSLQENDLTLYKHLFGECWDIAFENFLGQLKICS